MGHSQGTLTFFLAYMNNPEFMENNIAKFIALGTVPNVNNAPHFLIKLVEKSKILDLIPVKNMLTFPKELGQILVPFCTSKAKVLCHTILSLSFSGAHELVEQTMINWVKIYFYMNQVVLQFRI